MGLCIDDGYNKNCHRLFLPTNYGYPLASNRCQSHHVDCDTLQLCLFLVHCYTVLAYTSYLGTIRYDSRQKYWKMLTQKSHFGWNVSA